MFNSIKPSFLLSILLTSQSIIAQDVVSSTGGNGKGAGGTVSYTVGQIAQGTLQGESGTMIQGVQQPYEISVTTEIENTEDIVLELKVYPNPTYGRLTLIVEDFNNEKLEYELYGTAGVMIESKKIESSRTEISMDNLFPAVYFLKITKNKIGLKTFKIIKR